MTSIGGGTQWAAPRSLPTGHLPPARPAGSVARRVLLADPCGDTVESTAWLLRLWGHDVRGVGSGHEALEVARAYRPDTMLMEIALPGLDGCEVARRVRHQATGPEVLLVALTGYGDQKHRRRSLEAGFDYHLVKPVEPEALQSLLAMDHQEAGGKK